MTNQFASFLLVDDDPDDHEIFTSVLSMISPNVACTCFEDSGLALQELSTKEINFDVIFVDLNMPKLDGWDFLKMARTIDGLSSIPIYIYSTSSDPQIRDKAIAMGATGFITKSVSIKDLTDLLSAITKK